MRKMGILRVDIYEFEGVKDLKSKVVELKKLMETHTTNNDSIGATATAYNIIHILRQIETLEHKEINKKDSTRLKIRMRTKILDSFSKQEDPEETLKKILEDLG